MAIQWGRDYTLTITANGADSLVYRPPMQISFRIDNYFGSNEGIADISVYGLSRESMLKLQSDYTELTLEAGYADSQGLIYRGKIITFATGREGPDQFIRFHCRSMTEREGNSVISRTWGVNTPFLDVIRDAAMAFNLPVHVVGDFSDLGRAISGRSYTGTARQLLNRMQMGKDGRLFMWSVNNSGVTLRRADSHSDETHEVNANTGMVGPPKILAQRIEVDVLMNPAIQVWDRIDVSAQSRIYAYSGIYSASPDEIDPRAGMGLYTVFNVRHQGNFYGDQWISSLEAWRTDGESGVSQ